MSWVHRHRVFSLIVVLVTPVLAAARMAPPDEDEKKISVKNLPDSLLKTLKGWDVDEVEATVLAQEVLAELEEATTADAIPADLRMQSDRHFSDAKDMKFQRKLIAAYEIEGLVNGKARKGLVTSTGAEIEFEHDNRNEGDDE